MGEFPDSNPKTPQNLPLFGGNIQIVAKKFLLQGQSFVSHMFCTLSGEETKNVIFDDFCVETKNSIIDDFWLNKTKNFDETSKESVIWQKSWNFSQGELAYFLLISM